MSEAEMQDPGEGPSSSTYPDVTAIEPNPTIIADQDVAMPESEQADESESEESLDWEDVNLMPIVRGEVVPDKLAPPNFGKDHSYPSLSPVRTSVPFPDNWTEAQKAAAISPNSPYYTPPQPRREFPPDWTPQQIAAANSPTSPYYVAPHIPIVSTTPRLPVKTLPGLFMHTEASSSTQSVPQFINPALLSQNPPQFDNPESSSHYPSQSSTPTSSGLRAQEIYEKRNDGEEDDNNDDDDGDDSTQRVWARQEDRPAPLKPKSRIAKFGNLHRQETAKDTNIRPIGGPNPANASTCANCLRSKDDIRAEVIPRIRMEETAKIRNELEPRLREHLEGTIEIERAQKITDLQFDLEKLRKEHAKLWREKDRQEMDFKRQAVEYASKRDQQQNEALARLTKECEAKLEAAGSKVQEGFEPKDEVMDENQYQAQLAEIQQEFDRQLAENQKQYQNALAAKQGEFDQRLAEKQQEFDRQLAEKQQEFDRQLAENQRQYQNALAAKQAEFDQRLAEKQQELEDQIAANQGEFAQRFAELDQDVSSHAYSEREEVCEQRLAEKQREFDFRFADLHQEYSNLLAEKQKIIDELVAEKNQRELGTLSNTQPVLSLEQIQAGSNEDMMDVKEQMDPHSQAEIREELEPQIRAEGEDERASLVQENDAAMQTMFDFKSFEKDSTMPEVDEEGEEPSTKVSRTVEFYQEKFDKETAKIKAQCEAKLLEETQRIEKHYEEKLNAKTQADIESLVQERLQQEAAQMQQNFNTKFTQMQHECEAQFAKKVVSLEKEYEEKLRAAKSRDPYTPSDQNAFDSFVTGFSKLAITDSSKPAEAQDSSKSDIASSSKPIDTDSSKAVIVDLTELDSSDSFEPLAADSSKSVDIQKSSETVLTQGSSKPVDSPHSYKAELEAAYEQYRANLYQKYEKAVATMQKELQENFDQELAKEKRKSDESLSEKLAELEQQCDAKIKEERAVCRAQLEQQNENLAQLEANYYAEKKKQFDEKLELHRAQLQELFNAKLQKACDEQRKMLQQLYDDEIKSERIKVRESILAEMTESSERKSSRKIGKTDGQDAEKSDRTDRQSVRTTSKTDGQDPELLKAKKQLTELQDKQKLLQADLDAMHKSHSLLSTELVDAVKREQVSVKLLESSKTRVPQLEDSVRAAEATIQITKAQLSAKDRQMTELRNQVLHLRHELIEACTLASEANELVENLRLVSDEAEANVDSLKEANQELFRRNEDLTLELRAKEPEGGQEMLEVALQARAGLEEDWRKSSTRTDQWESQDAMQKQELRRLNAQDAMQKQELRRLNAQVTAFQGDRDALTKQLHEAQQLQGSLSADALKLRAENDAANSDIKALTKQLHEAQQLQSSHAAEASRLRAEEAARAEKAARAEEAALRLQEEDAAWAEDVALREPRKKREKGHVEVPKRVAWQLALFALICSLLFCAFSLFCFVGLAAEREAQEWLGWDDMPRGAKPSSVGLGIGKGGIW